MIICDELKDGELKNALQSFNGVFYKISLNSNEFTKIMKDDFPLNLYTEVLIINGHLNLNTIDANFIPSEDQYNAIVELNAMGNLVLR